MAVRRTSTFASLLKHHRDAVGLTQEELAGRAGVGARTVSNLERGVNRAPYRATIRRLAEALDLSEEGRTELQNSTRLSDDEPANEAKAGRAGCPARIEGGFLGAVPSKRLVAREEELQRISTALEEAASGSGRLAFLAGEPGIGKTRLAQEASVEAWDSGFLVAAGRCYEAHGGVPFYPFLEALDTLYKDAPPKVREESPERWPCLARLLPDHFPSQSSGAEGREELQWLLRAAAGFVREVSAFAPVAILLDDLHCADGASLDLLSHLARHTRGDRVMILGTYRDMEVGPDHPLRKAVRELGREQLVEKIPVRRLQKEETVALMSDRLDGSEVSEEFAKLVFRQTEGNPFFTVEVLNALIERGDLLWWEGSWIRKDIEIIETPESIHEAISERVSRLRPETQEILKEASILGQAFSFADLQSASSRTGEEVDDALEEAVASGLIRTSKDGCSFTHALIQHTLYTGLSPIRRKRLHNAVGEGLENLGGQAGRKRAAELARHFIEGDSPAQALPHAILAGDEAEAVFAHGEAERHYRSALELAEEVDGASQKTEAMEKLGGVLAATVRYDEALSILELASDNYDALDDPESACRVEARISQAHFRRGTANEGVARLSSHLESLDKPGAPHGVKRSLAALYGGLARLHYALGRHASSTDAAARGASLSREVSDDRSLAEAEMARGTSLLWLDAPDEAMTVLEEAALIAERSGATDTLSTVLLSLTMAYTRHGEFGLGRERGERGISVAERSGDADILALHTSNVGLLLFHLGDWAESRTYLERGVELARGGPRSLFSCLLPAYLGVLYQAKGEWEESSECLSDAVAGASEMNRPQILRYAHSRLAEQELLRGRPHKAISRLEPYLGEPNLTWMYDILTLSSLAEGYADIGDPAKGEEVADRAVKLARLARNKIDGVEALRARGKSLSMQARRTEATEAFEEALSWSRSMPAPYAEAKVLREYGMLHLREGEPEKARRRLSEALEIFRLLGAKMDAEYAGRTLQKSVRA